MIKEILLFIKVLFSPSYWVMTDGAYSKKFDKFCRDAILDGSNFERYYYYWPENKSDCRCYLKGKLLWVENHPYASFTYAGMRPSRRTKILLRERYEEGLL